MKLLVMPSKQSNLDCYKDCDGFIVGLKDYCWFMPYELSIDELSSFVSKIKKDNKEIYISLNKLMYNKDISLLEEYLLIIDKLNIDGIMFEDLAVPRISKSLNIKTPLIWSSIHLFTNYFTANYWVSKGVNKGLLSTEINLNDIKEIHNNTKMSLMMYGYGYIPMFISARSLLSSYFNYIKKDKDSDKYYMYEKITKNSHLTYEHNDETVILSSHILNTIKELPILNKTIDYLILSSLNIEEDKFINIYNNYIKALNDIDNLDYYEELVNNEYPNNTDKGFLYKETIYRLKNTDKDVDNRVKNNE